MNRCLPKRAATELLLVLLLCAAPAAQALERAAFIQLAASVLKIEVMRVQGGYSLGSGVAVGDGMVVTNCHVTRDARQISVLRGGARWAVEAQASDVDHDLCVLSVPGIQATAVPLGNGMRLKTGQAVNAIGYTGGQEIQSSGGEVVALHPLDGSRVIQSTNWFSSGASGGGLFDDDLRLVGILTFRLRGGAAHYFAAPVEWLRPMLDRPGAFQAVAPIGGAERAFWERPEHAQPNFLKAAVYVRDRRWDALEPLAEQWARDDTTDAEPWSLQGLALQQLGRLPEARSALEHALAIEPASKEALLRLGLVDVQQGQLQSARDIQARLAKTRPELALQLQQAIDTK